MIAITIKNKSLRGVHRHYSRLHERLAVAGPFALEETDPPTVLVAYEERSRMSDRALRFAMTLSPDVIAVHLLKLAGPEAEVDMRGLRDAFEREIAAPIAGQGLIPPRLMMIPAPYREIAGPVLELVDKIDADTPGRSVAILIPQLVLRHWWERLLHGRRAARLRAALLAKAGPRLMIVTSPWQG